MPGTVLVVAEQTLSLIFRLPLKANLKDALRKFALDFHHATSCAVSTTLIMILLRGIRISGNLGLH